MKAVAPLVTDIFKDSKFKWEISINYRQIVDWGTYSPEDLKELQERVRQQKMNELFEEPSTYEDEDE